MNKRNHYFGAFLVIQVKEQEFRSASSQCHRGHQDPGPFCRQCGLPVSVEWEAVKRYPTHVYQLLPDGLADTLSVITPAEMFGTGTIIARSNSNAGVWVVIKGDTIEQSIRVFPTEAEISALIDALASLPAVQALRDHPDVESIKVRAGYVEDSEY
jgi:hypothetical protein